VQSLQREQQSPKLERARGGKPVKDITQLYTAAFNKNEATPEQLPSPVRPRRNDNITKLYTGGFEKENNKVNYKLKPNDELTNPKKVSYLTVSYPDTREVLLVQNNTTPPVIQIKSNTGFIHNYGFNFCAPVCFYVIFLSFSFTFNSFFVSSPTW
jgi:hypothetical protein